ncbi:MAG: DUF4032 domain-containing protein [Candidatus Nanopelagicales bacterium]
MALAVRATAVDPDLLTLPWSTALEDWPPELIVALPRGISRHTVRFVKLGGVVHAIKEIEESFAQREYDLLHELTQLNVPSVRAKAVVSGRESADGEPLPAALITEHLQFSLPYRAVFSSTPRTDTAIRLLDALTLLIARLHILGFAWNDCSLSNTLFRRDAGEFAAYLVDAETGEMYPTLSDGQRQYDIETASLNCIGELMDLQAGGRLPDAVDPISAGQSLVSRYHRLWALLTEPITIAMHDRKALNKHISSLNRLGFDVGEIELEATDHGQARVHLKPKVVDQGHHARRLLRLTGLDVEEHQAQRLLNDLDAFHAEVGASESEEIVSHRWVSEMFEPIVMSVPKQLRRKLEPAQIFHEVLENRWYMSEQAGRDVGLEAATQAYIAHILARKPDEIAVLGTPAGLEDTIEIPIVDHDLDGLPLNLDEDPDDANP